MSDKVIKSSTATIQVGATKADGKLELTESDLIFIPYNEKLGFGPYQLKRQDIAAVAKCLGQRWWCNSNHYGCISYKTSQQYVLRVYCSEARAMDRSTR
ncbi:hypothetical protein NI379_06560 [Vibrio parahaemolyticus]|nr:hypothetical protein NI379_06560 [Vibrio parahaemolyticus]